MIKTYDFFPGNCVLMSVPLNVVILAAGKGTRMKSALPKVLHRIAGRSMVGHVLDNLAALNVAKTAVVIAPGMDAVAREVAPHPTVLQQEQFGTGHAVAWLCMAAAMAPSCAK